MPHVPELVHILDEDPDLAVMLNGPRRSVARRRALARRSGFMLYGSLPLQVEFLLNRVPRQPFTVVRSPSTTPARRVLRTSSAG